MKPSISQQVTILNACLGIGSDALPDGVRIYEDGWVSCNVPAYNNFAGSNFDENFFIPVYNFTSRTTGKKVMSGFSFLQFWKMPDASNVERNYLTDPQRPWEGNGSARYVTVTNSDLPTPFDEKFFHFLTRQGDAGGWDAGNFSGGGGGPTPETAIITDTASLQAGLTIPNNGIRHTFDKGNFVDRGANIPFGGPFSIFPISWGFDVSAAARTKLENILGGTWGVDIELQSLVITHSPFIDPNLNTTGAPSLSVLRKGLPQPASFQPINGLVFIPFPVDLAYIPLFTWRSKQRVFVEFDGSNWIKASPPNLENSYLAGPVTVASGGGSPFIIELKNMLVVDPERESFNVQGAGYGGTGNIIFADIESYNSVTNTLRVQLSSLPSVGQRYEISWSNFFDQVSNYYPNYTQLASELVGSPVAVLELGQIRVQATYQKV